MTGAGDVLTYVLKRADLRAVFRQRRGNAALDQRFPQPSPGEITNQLLCH
jgi:hypothetical protein